MTNDIIAKHFYGAYKRGRAAYAKEKQSYEECPYPDYRGGRYGNIITYSRAFRRYWYKGWQDAEQNKPDRYAEEIQHR